MSVRPSPTLARLVRQFRLHAELSQAELAERSGLSARQISDLERGLRVLFWRRFPPGGRFDGTVAWLAWGLASQSRFG